ncbi:hypothetical protein BC739_005988 [Kutzneria viridogrisea]|uniref:DUF4333 domain-containing protein n=1 Tax=Kutzneria viridogrisea TaxID=47990 RepID=A0ABR6BPD0_9PSEU|nr:hypothetical protein [Kutzneria viridogrisea]
MRRLVIGLSVAAVLAMGGVAGVFLSGLSTEATANTADGKVARATVEQTLGDKLSTFDGRRPDHVTCAGDLSALPGTQLNCTATYPGDSADRLVVSPTGSRDGQIRYDFVVLANG